MIKEGSTYKLDDRYLKCTKVRKSGVNTFQVCDRSGIIKEPIYVGGLIADYGTRIVYLRTKELVNVVDNE